CMSDEETKTRPDSLSLHTSTQTGLIRRSGALIQRGLRDIRVGACPIKRILVVDDEQAIRDVICAMLTSLGYECQEVPNGQDAVALLESGEEFDIIFHDVLNAPMDGFTLLQHLTQNHPKVTVVVASAVHDIDLVRACLQNGAFDYLLEPFERTELYEVLRRA